MYLKKILKDLPDAKRKIEVVYFGVSPNFTIDKRKSPVQKNKNQPVLNHLHFYSHTQTISKLQEISTSTGSTEPLRVKTQKNLF